MRSDSGKPAASEQVTSLGIVLDTGDHAFGRLQDATPALAEGRYDVLRARYDEDGYLLLRGLLDREEARAAQAEIVDSLAARGLLDTDHPLRERIAARHARISKFGFEGEDRRFATVRRLVLSTRMHAFYELFFGSAARAFDYVWLRLMAPGQATPPHCDIVYMGRGTDALCSNWIPLTDVGRDDGPLMLLEGSHRIQALRDDYCRMDIDTQGNWRRLKLRHGSVFRGGDYSRDPRRVSAQFGRRWLTAEFAPGDVLLFSPYLMHASLDNRSLRFRISADVRYQRADEPIDPRWIGEHPIGHSQAR